MQDQEGDLGPTVAPSAESLRAFLERKEESTLRAWLKHFDINNTTNINVWEFQRGMRRLQVNGDVHPIFNALDVDNSGDVSLEEIDAAAAKLWTSFRHYCVKAFQGPRDMLMQLSGGDFNPNPLVKERFAESLQAKGWNGGHEEVLFGALDIDNLGHICVTHLRWLEIEKKRQRLKDQAKQRSDMSQLRRSDEKILGAALKDDFKAYLKNKFGSYIRAWRRCLDQDGSMSVQKHELFKACQDMGWQGDVRLLWKALDKDGSGVTSIEELDPRSGELLACFSVFAEQRFGNSAEIFHALDRSNSKKIKQADFIGACTAYGFTSGLKALFHGLDWQGKKFLVAEDLRILDRWRPPAHLTARPNEKAAEDLRAAIMATYNGYLKAWRLIDTDNSNKCSWDEFEGFCKKISFQGDVPGAWRALDDDLSGFISLQEIDKLASDTLMQFKIWTETEFGGVRSAFLIFDGDKSNKVSYREFLRACRAYGFTGNCRAIFTCFDIDGCGVLTLDEVVFLDEWDLPDEFQHMVGGGARPTLRGKAKSQRADSNLTNFETVGPGPGSYLPPSTVGAGPRVPMLRHKAAYTFSPSKPKTRLPELVARDAAIHPDGGCYNPALGQTVPSKPSFGFGTSARPSNEPSARQKASLVPGPGEYTLSPMQGSPRFTCSPRRPNRAHPLSKATL